MIDAILDHLDERVDDSNRLASALPPDAFAKRMSDRSNTIGSQFWCLVGARESYSRGIEAGAWQGFECSLRDIERAEEVIAKLASSTEPLLGLRERESWSRAQVDLLLGLLEHESQHQGQLIRYFYALGVSFPESFAQRWALAD